MSTYKCYERPSHVYKSRLAGVGYLDKQKAWLYDPVVEGLQHEPGQVHVEGDKAVQLLLRLGLAHRPGRVDGQRGAGWRGRGWERVRDGERERERDGEREREMVRESQKERERVK